MPAILFRSENDSPEEWAERLEERIPGLDFRIWPDVGDPDDIQFALVWKLPSGALSGLPNLRTICSLGQGVDHIFADPDLPEGPRVMRIVDPWMGRAMAEWVLLNVLRFHRLLPEYEALQAAHEWKPMACPETSKRRVGILGMGELGNEAAESLISLGFDVSGWSRTEKSIFGVTSYFGADQLDGFLARADILVCLLPLTDETKDIIDADLLAKLPKGAQVINGGRGGHVVDEDLIAALDSGHIAGAALDVFRIEPLPPEHVFWGHPKVLVWPHVSAPTNADSGADQIADAIHKTFAGEAPDNLVDRARQY